MHQTLSVLDANVRDLQSGVAIIRETQTVSLESQVYARKVISEVLVNLPYHLQVRVLLERDIMLQGSMKPHI